MSLIWIYIAGCGRSGSTLLDRLLGRYPSVLSSGELGRLPHLLSSGMCACGQPLDECPIWSRTLEHVRLQMNGCNDTTRRELRQAEDWRGLIGTLAGRTPVSTERRYQTYIRAIEEAIEGGTGATHIVDSSKTASDFANRPLLLLRAGLNIRSIHLIRDGRAVVWSRIMAEQRFRAFGKSEMIGVDLRNLPAIRLPSRVAVAARATASWVFGNVVALLLAHKLPDESAIVLTYEELTNDPIAVVGRIAKWLTVSSASSDTPNINHQLAGNRARHFSIGNITPDEAWRDNLQWPERVVFWILGWPMAALHGRYLKGIGKPARESKV